MVHEAAQRCKTGLKDITYQILTSKSNLTMGDDGEWRINSTEDPLDINATDVNQDIGGASDISGPVETGINERADEYFQFVTPTLMGKVNDHMNNSIRRYDLNELKTYQVLYKYLCNHARRLRLENYHTYLYLELSSSRSSYGYFFNHFWI